MPSSRHNERPGSSARKLASVSIVYDTPARVELAIVGHELRLVANRGLDHAQAQRSVGHRRRAVRRVRARHDVHLVEIQQAP